MKSLTFFPSTTPITHTKSISQDLSSSNIPFTSGTCYQDITLLGIPANHFVSAVKIATIQSFAAGNNTSVWLYVGPMASLGTVDTTSGIVIGLGSFCAQANLSPLLNSVSNVGINQYGTYKWFSVGAPGSVVNRNNWLPSPCVPVSFAAQDIVARFFVTVGSSPTVPTANIAVPRMSQISSGSVEISVQYMAF